MESDVQDTRKVRRARLAERRALVARKYLEGKTQPQISLELGLAQSTVCEDLNALIDGWKKKANIDIGDKIAEELMRIDNLEHRAWEGYANSCLPKRIAKVIKKHDRSNPALFAIVSIGKVIERPEGDPRFLMVIAKCSDMRVHLLRLDKRADKDEQEKQRPTFVDAMTLYWKQREAAEKLPKVRVPVAKPRGPLP